MASPERRALRRERWAALFSPSALALSGAAISVAYLFQRSLAIRAAMFLCFLLATLLSGKKASLVATLVVSAGIVAANLLVPVGKVIALLGPFRITETALVDGLGKALVFEGLLYASKASIAPGLRLPGRFGALVASAFVYYDRIVEYKGAIRPATLVEDADALMLKVWAEVPAEARAAVAVRGKSLPTLALVAAVVASYALLLPSLPRLY
jgi:hypothetical protein